jgi:large subunit ribosomal protein L25
MTFSLQAKKRTEKTESIRTAGMIPAVLYGPQIKSVSISLDYMPFKKLYDEAGESTLIDLTIDKSEPTKVLIQDIQYDPVRGTIIHADLRQINMNVEMEANVDLEFINEAPAVKESSGTLMTQLNSVEVKCLPKDLVSRIIVDISVLKTFEDTIRIKDLVVPPGIKINLDPEALVVKVSPPISEEQLKAMEAETASIEDIEVEEKGKKEEEGEEGAESADSKDTKAKDSKEK